METQGMKQSKHTKTNRLFGQKVQAVRKQHGMTQAELAAKINRSEDMIGNVERGASSTRLTTVYDLSAALNVNLADLFDFGDLPRRDREHQRVVRDIVKLLNEQDLAAVKRVRKMLSAMLEQQTAAE